VKTLTSATLRFQSAEKQEKAGAAQAVGADKLRGGRGGARHGQRAKVRVAHHGMGVCVRCLRLPQL
jgi:hypothetical protein